VDEHPHGYALDAGAGERLVFGDVTVLVRATAASTGGAFTLFEEGPPLLDTPLHVHALEDELFHVLEGEHVVRCGEREWRVGPGAVVFLPQRVPHAHRRVVPGDGKLLVLTTPGGFDGFLRELAGADRAGTLGPQAYAAASERYGITWLD
jgi:mannose-6-phosphate isomerase-like protein (cupin superfamily)